MINRFSSLIKAPCDPEYVTFVGRRNYGKRKLGRVWTNLDEIANYTRTLTDMPVRVVYYEELSWEDQLDVDCSTAIMIGTHGAGLVHALFTPPSATLIEVFPKHKRRWGYRNIASYKGIKYIEFRGGRDGPRESKIVPVSEWEPLMLKILP